MLVHVIYLRLDVTNDIVGCSLVVHAHIAVTCTFEGSKPGKTTLFRVPHGSIPLLSACSPNLEYFLRGVTP
jgi:hypothetical protein